MTPIKNCEKRTLITGPENRVPLGIWLSRHSEPIIMTIIWLGVILAPTLLICKTVSAQKQADKPALTQFSDPAPKITVEEQTNFEKANAAWVDAQNKLLQGAATVPADSDGKSLLVLALGYQVASERRASILSTIAAENRSFIDRGYSFALDDKGKLALVAKTAPATAEAKPAKP